MTLFQLFNLGGVLIIIGQDDVLARKNGFQLDNHLNKNSLRAHAPILARIRSISFQVLIHVVCTICIDCVCNLYSGIM